MKSESKVKEREFEKNTASYGNAETLHSTTNVEVVFTLLGYLGITVKVTAREFPEYRHYVLSFVDNFWQICGIRKGAEPTCVQTGSDV
jgi:hypothetical protein